MCHQLYGEEPWHSRGICFLPVDNYLIFYLPKDPQNTVNIVRIMYGDRDVRRKLSETVLLFLIERDISEFTVVNFLYPEIKSDGSGADE